MGGRGELEESANGPRAVLRSKLQHSPAVRVESCHLRRVMVHQAGVDERANEVLVKIDPVLKAPHEQRIGLGSRGIEKAKFGLEKKQQAGLEIELRRGLAILTAEQP